LDIDRLLIHITDSDGVLLAAEPEPVVNEEEEDSKPKSKPEPFPNNKEEDCKPAPKFKPVSLNTVELRVALQNIQDLIAAHGAYMRYSLQAIADDSLRMGNMAGDAAALSPTSKLHSFQLLNEMEKLANALGAPTTAWDDTTQPLALNTIRNTVEMAGATVILEMPMADMTAGKEHLRLKEFPDFNEMIALLSQSNASPDTVSPATTLPQVNKEGG
jgi:hypothetical protein